MSTVIRFAVVGEGRDEHGCCHRGPDLSPLPQGELRGALVTLVLGLLRERFAAEGVAVRWSLVDRQHSGRPGPPPSPVQILRDPNLLGRLLDKLLDPIALQPPGRSRADFVVLSVDAENRSNLRQSVNALRPVLRNRVIALVFERELEILFLQSKWPLKRAAGIAECSSQPPALGPQPKECLREWLKLYAPRQDADASFKQRVAEVLKISRDSALNRVLAWQQLLDELPGCLNAGNKKGPAEGDPFQ